jgi:hypothetical protein
MNLPKRIQLSRRAGWRMPPDTVKVDRTTIFGNPFPVSVYGRAGAVLTFDRWLSGAMSAAEMATSSRQDRWSAEEGVSLTVLRAKLLAELPRLTAKDLACWCRSGDPCHAQILLRLANERFSRCCEAA